MGLAHRMGTFFGCIIMAPFVILCCVKMFSPAEKLNGTIASIGDKGVMVQYVDDYGWTQEIAVSCKDPDSYTIGESVIVRINELLLDTIITVEKP